MFVKNRLEIRKNHQKTRDFRLVLTDPSLKEANETDYWLDLLNKTDYINNFEYNKFKRQIQEILKLLVSIVKSSKQ